MSRLAPARELPRRRDAEAVLREALEDVDAIEDVIVIQRWRKDHVPSGYDARLRMQHSDASLIELLGMLEESKLTLWRSCLPELEDPDA